MSKKRQLHNQLEDFFDELEIEAESPPEPAQDAAPVVSSGVQALESSTSAGGWTWECTPSGRITACSPEIETHLGYTPAEAVGQSMDKFAVEQETGQKLRQALQSRQLNEAIQVVYLSSDGRRLRGRLSFLSQEAASSDNGRRAMDISLKGFTQILEVETPPDPHSLEETQEAFTPESIAPEPSPVDSSGPADVPADVPADIPVPTPASASEAPVAPAPPGRPETQADTPGDSTPVDQEPAPPPEHPAYIPQKPGTGVLERLKSDSQPLNPDRLPAVEAEALPAEAPAPESEPVDESAWEPEYSEEEAAQASVEGEVPAGTISQFESGDEKKILAPIRIQNQPLGILELVDDDPGRVWSEEEQRLINDVVDQLSLALENAELFQQTQDALSETERLYQISADFNAAANLEDILKSIGIPNESGQRPFAVTLWKFEPGEDGHPLWMVFSSMWAQPGRVLRTHLGTRLYLPEFPGSEVLFANPFEPMLFPDIAHDRIDPSTRQIVEHNGGAAVAFLPLSLRGQWIGQISILWDAPTEFSSRDHHRYRSLAAQASVAVNNRLLFEQSEQRAQQLEWLSLIKDSLSQSIDESGILSAVSMSLNQSMPPMWINLSYFQTDPHGTITGAETAGYWQDGMIRDTQPEFDAQEYLAAYQSLELFKSLPEGIRFLGDVPHHTYSSPELASLAEKDGFASICLMPLFSSGRWQGAITFVWRGVYELTSDEAFFLRELLEPLAAFVASRRSYLAEQEARQSMERRNLQLQTAAQVSRAASSVLDPEALVGTTVEIVQSRFDLYYVGLFLIDETGAWSGEANKWAVLRAGTGEAGRKMLEQGHRLAINGASMIGTCIGTKKAQIWRGDEQDINRFRNPVLPDTRSEMALPLISRGDVIGAMTFQSVRAGDFSEADISVLQTMADQVANAIQNARLYARTEAALSETSTLYAIANAASRSLELREMLGQVLDQTLTTTRFDAGVVSAYNPDADRLELMAYQQLPEPFLQRLLDQGLENTLCSLVFERAEVISVHNMATDAPMDVTSLVNMGLHSYLGVPLKSKGRVLGTICLFGKTVRSSMEADLILMEAIAQQAGIAVENANLFTQTQVALTETEVLYKASAELNTAQDYEDVLETLAAYTVFGKNAQNISINIFDRPWSDDGEPEWINVLARRSALPESATSARYPVAAFPSIREILRPDAPSILQDLEKEGSLDPNARRLYIEQFGAKSTIFVPIVVGGQWIGFFNAIYQQPTHFDAKDIRRLNALTNQSAVAIQNLQSVEITRQQANDATLLFESSQQLVQAKSEEAIYLAALKALRQFGSIDFLAIYRFKEVTGERYLEQVVHSRLPDFPAPEDYTLYPVNLYPFTQQVRSGESIYSDALRQDARFNNSEKELLERLSMGALAVLPIRLRSEVTGVLIAAHRQPHTHSIREKRFLETIIVQLNIALENYHLLQETQRRARQLQTAAEVSRTTNSILETDELLQQVVNLVQERFNLYYAGLFLVEEHEAENASRWAVLRAGTGIAGMQMKAQGHKLAVDEKSMIGRCVLHKQASVSLNVSLEPGHYKNPLLPKTASEMALPLVALGEAIGAVTIQSEHESAFTEDDIATLQTMADQVAIAIQNARLFGQTQEALSDTERLYRASAELNTAQNYAEILQVLVSHTLVFRDFRALNLYFFDRPWSENRPPESFQLTASLPEGQDIHILPLTSLATFPHKDQLLKQAVPFVVEDLNGSLTPEQEALASLYREQAGSSLLLLPLVVAGQAIGFLETIFETPRRFPGDVLKQLTALAAQAAVAFQNLHSLELAEQQAYEALIRSQELALLNRVVSNVSAHTDLKSALAEISHELGQALNVQVGIALMNETRSGLVIMAEHFPGGSQNSAIGLTIPITNNPSTQKVLETRRPLVIENATTNPLTSQLHQDLAARNVETLNILPMLVGNEVIGTVGLDILERGRKLTDDEMRLAESIILQASTAIQNVRLFEQTQEALTESEALYQANSELNTAQTYQAVLDILRRHTILGNGVSALTVSIFDQPWVTDRVPSWYIPIAWWSSRPEYQLQQQRMPLKEWEMAEQLLQPNFPTFIADPEHDPRLDETTLKIVAGQVDARGILFAPLNATGRWIGHIVSVYRQSMDFSEAELRRLTTLVGQAAVVIQNIRNTELTRQRAAQLEKLAGVQSALSQAGDEAEILSALVLPTNPERPPRSIKLWYLQVDEEEAPQSAELAAAWENGAIQRLPNLQRVGIAQDPLSRLWLEYPDKTLFIQSIEDDRRLNVFARSELRARGDKSLVLIPLRSGGTWQGVVIYSWDREQEFNEDDRFLLGRILEPASEVIARRRAFIVQRQTAERLLEVDALKTQFLANMSHELRTPLNSIIGFSRVILKGIDGPVTELQQQDLGAIYNSGQHLLSLINDILDLSKIEAGKMELAIEEVDLADLINSVMSTAVGLTKEKPIELQREIQPDLPLVHADRTRIRQVLINLLSNAAKFTEEGFIKIQARSQVNANGQEEIWVGVIDSGPGISIEDQDKLFKAFSQVDASPTRKSGGTGLGLSISRHLVDMHGGEIGVESQLGQGSTFYFTLPLPQPVETSYSLPDNGRPIILSVDDNRQVISLYERYLSNHNYNIIPVTEPHQALELARRLQPFAITLDIMMPGKDGWSLLEQLKQDPETRHIPVIICSILEDQEKGFSLGAVDYLVKPILEEDLIQAVQRLNRDETIRRVLVVDDDPNDLRLVQKILEQNGDYAVDTAEGGQDALVRLEAGQPNAIILDLYMPGLDGFSLLETLQANPQTRGIPVIIFTGGDLDEEQRSLLTAAGQAMLQKSLFTEDELLKTLERSLHRFAVQANLTAKSDS